MRLILTLSIIIVLFACQPKEKKFYQTGELRKEYTLQDGKANGEMITYYKDGTIKGEYYFVNGKTEGLVKEYYPSGNLMKKAKFTNGVQNGITKEYYKNGILKSIQNFKDSLFHGDFYFYYENGAIKTKWTSKNDTTTYFKEYSNNGELIDFYRKINIEPQKDTVLQGGKFEIDVEVLGSLEDINRIETIVSSVSVSDTASFSPLDEIKSEYQFKFEAKDTGWHYFNMKIYEKDTTYFKYSKELFSKEKQSN